MAIAVLVGRDEKENKLSHWFIEAITQQLLALNPTTDIRIWPNMGNLDDIDLALVWRHSLGALKNLPQLKCIGSLAAGVDHVLVDADLPKNIPLIRVMDPYMAHDIVQYVLTYTLHYIKRVAHWGDCQKKNTWSRKPPFNFSDKTIGIMGLGFLGKQAAQTLQSIGLNVIGWSHSHKNLPGIKDFAGADQFDDFLTQTDILVCLLPLTSQTENILNHATFSRLKYGACIINVGRGAHLVEDELISNLDSGQLEQAYLDVFHQEPLPTEHPFWTHPKIVVTPHIASVTNPKTAVPQLIETYSKLLAGEAVVNLVNLTKGY